MLQNRQPTKRYQLANWFQYNEALVNRGDITLWFDESVIENWSHENRGLKKGRPFTYSDSAILTLLMLREFFQLPYRQTEGLGRALVSMLGVDVKIPDYSSLAKRSKTLKVDIDVALQGRKVVDLVVDSTGLKAFGEGEWKVKQHGASAPRMWRKLHLAVDPTSHQIVAEVLTPSSCSDGEKALELVDNSPATVNRFYGDGAYDHWNIHNVLIERKVKPIIPPRRGSKIKQHGNCQAKPLPRDEAVHHIYRHGRKSWKEDSGYHRRSNAETTMSRMKMAFGERIKNRSLKNQQTEVAIRCKLLNLFAAIELPLSLWC